MTNDFLNFLIKRIVYKKRHVCDYYYHSLIASRVIYTLYRNKTIYTYWVIRRPTLPKGCYHKTEEHKQKICNTLKMKYINNKTLGFKPGHKMNIGRVTSDETKEKIRQSKLGKKRPEMSGPNHPLYGKHRSEIVKQKLQRAFIGRFDGKNNPNYGDGRRIDHDGYIHIYFPDHPYSDRNNCVLEHRLVMEASIGRYLTPDEIVHHIDENTQNNIISNLQLMTASEHTRYHHLGKHHKKCV